MARRNKRKAPFDSRWGINLTDRDIGRLVKEYVDERETAFSVWLEQNQSSLPTGSGRKRGIDLLRRMFVGEKLSRETVFNRDPSISERDWPRFEQWASTIDWSKPLPNLFERNSLLSDRAMDAAHVLMKNIYHDAYGLKFSYEAPGVDPDDVPGIASVRGIEAMRRYTPDLPVQEWSNPVKRGQHFREYIRTEMVRGLASYNEQQRRIEGYEQPMYLDEDGEMLTSQVRQSNAMPDRIQPLAQRPISSVMPQWKKLSPGQAKNVQRVFSHLGITYEGEPTVEQVYNVYTQRDALRQQYGSYYKMPSELKPLYEGTSRGRAGLQNIFDAFGRTVRGRTNLPGYAELHSKAISRYTAGYMDPDDRILLEGGRVTQEDLLPDERYGDKPGPFTLESAHARLNDLTDIFEMVRGEKPRNNPGQYADLRGWRRTNQRFTALPRLSRPVDPAGSRWWAREYASLFPLERQLGATPTSRYLRKREELTSMREVRGAYDSYVRGEMTDIYDRANRMWRESGSQANFVDWMEAEGIDAEFVTSTFGENYLSFEEFSKRIEAGDAGRAYAQPDPIKRHFLSQTAAGRNQAAAYRRVRTITPEIDRGGSLRRRRRWYAPLDDTGDPEPGYKLPPPDPGYFGEEGPTGNRATQIRTVPMEPNPPPDPNYFEKQPEPSRATTARRSLGPSGEKPGFVYREAEAGRRREARQQRAMESRANRESVPTQDSEEFLFRRAENYGQMVEHYRGVFAAGLSESEDYEGLVESFESIHGERLRYLADPYIRSLRGQSPYPTQEELLRMSAPERNMSYTAGLRFALHTGRPLDELREAYGRRIPPHAQRELSRRTVQSTPTMIGATPRNEAIAGSLAERARNLGGFEPHDYLLARDYEFKERSLVGTSTDLAQMAVGDALSTGLSGKDDPDLLKSFVLRTREYLNDWFNKQLEKAGADTSEAQFAKDIRNMSGDLVDRVVDQTAKKLGIDVTSGQLNASLNRGNIPVYPNQRRGRALLESAYATDPTTQSYIDTYYGSLENFVQRGGVAPSSLRSGYRVPPTPGFTASGQGGQGGGRGGGQGGPGGPWGAFGGSRNPYAGIRAWYAMRAISGMMQATYGSSVQQMWEAGEFQNNASVLAGAGMGSITEMANLRTNRQLAGGLAAEQNFGFIERGVSSLIGSSVGAQRLLQGVKLGGGLAASGYMANSILALMQAPTFAALGPGMLAAGAAVGGAYLGNEIYNAITGQDKGLGTRIEELLGVGPDRSRFAAADAQARNILSFADRYGMDAADVSNVAVASRFTGTNWRGLAVSAAERGTTATDLYKQLATIASQLEPLSRYGQGRSINQMLELDSATLKDLELRTEASQPFRGQLAAAYGSYGQANAFINQILPEQFNQQNINQLSLATSLQSAALTYGVSMPYAATQLSASYGAGAISLGVGQAQTAGFESLLRMGVAPQSAWYTVAGQRSMADQVALQRMASNYVQSFGAGILDNARVQQTLEALASGTPSDKNYWMQFARQYEYFGGDVRALSQTSRPTYDEFAETQVESARSIRSAFGQVLGLMPPIPDASPIPDEEAAINRRSQSPILNYLQNYDEQHPGAMAYDYDRGQLRGGAGLSPLPSGEFDEDTWFVQQALGGQAPTAVVTSDRPHTVEGPPSFLRSYQWMFGVQEKEPIEERFKKLHPFQQAAASSLLEVYMAEGLGEQSAAERAIASVEGLDSFSAERLVNIQRMAKGAGYQFSSDQLKTAAVELTGPAGTNFQRVIQQSGYMGFPGSYDLLTQIGSAPGVMGDATLGLMSTYASMGVTGAPALQQAALLSQTDLPTIGAANRITETLYGLGAGQGAIQLGARYGMMFSNPLQRGRFEDLAQAGVGLGASLQGSIALASGGAALGNLDYRNLSQFLSGDAYQYSLFAQSNPQYGLTPVIDIATGMSAFQQQQWNLQAQQHQLSYGQKLFQQQQGWAQYNQSRAMTFGGSFINPATGQMQTVDYGRLDINQALFDLSIRQGQYNLDYQAATMALSNRQQAYNIDTSQAQQQRRMEWRMEDWAYGENVNQLQFGWQMEDFDMNIRYARGRDRRQLLRQRERAVITESMRRGHSEEERSRLEEQKQWMEERHQKEREFFDENRRLQEERLQREREFFQERTEWQRRQQDMARLEAEVNDANSRMRLQYADIMIQKEEQLYQQFVQLDQARTQAQADMDMFFRNTLPGIISNLATQAQSIRLGPTTVTPQPVYTPQPTYTPQPIQQPTTIVPDGTQQYMDQLRRTYAQAQFTNYRGSQVRIDMYDPNHSGGMDPYAWYVWKDRGMPNEMSGEGGGNVTGLLQQILEVLRRIENMGGPGLVLNVNGQSIREQIDSSLELYDDAYRGF